MNKLIEMAIFSAIGALLIFSVLIPVTDSDNYRTYATNTVGYTASIIDDQDEITPVVMSWDVSDKKLIVDGLTYNYSINDVAAFADSWKFTTTTVSPFSTFVYNVGNTPTNLSYKTIELEITNTAVNVEYVDNSDVSHTLTVSHDWVCYRDNAGTDRIANVITTAKTVYYDSENVIIYGAGTSGVVFKGDKALKAGVEYDAILNGTTYKNNVDQASLYFTSASQYYTTIGGTDYYPMYIAVSGKIDTTNNTDNQTFDLIELIPLIVVAGLAILVVSAVVKRE